MGIRAKRLTAVLAALCLTGGASLAAAPDDESVTETPPMPPQQAVESVDDDQAAGYGILRRRQVASDRLPQEVAAYIERSVTPDNGVAPGLARRALIRPDGTAVYVIPGRGIVCRFATYPTGRASGGCARTGEALKGYMVGVETAAPGAVRVSGLVPDGVEEVVLRGADGSTERAVLEGNAYLFETTLTPRQIEWGGRVIPIASPRETFG